MLRKLIIAAAIAFASVSPALAYSQDFVNGIAYAVIYDKTCKPGSISPAAYHMLGRLSDSMTLGEMNHVQDLIRQSQDPAQKDTWQAWCAIMGPQSADFVKQLNESGDQFMRR